MLVSYTVKNYRSFYDEMTLDFRVLATEDEKTFIDENPYVVKINDDYISKLCLLYGANGAGKSNLLIPLEMLFLGKIESLFDPNMIKGKEESTSFEIVFYPNSKYKNSKILHTYKLVLDNKNKKVSSEIFSANEKIIFKRENSRIIESSEDILENLTISDKTTTFTHIENTSELRENKDIENIWLNFSYLIVPVDITYNKIWFGNAGKMIKKIYYQFVEMELLDFYKHLLFLADTGIEDIVMKDNISEYSSDLNKFLADNPIPDNIPAIVIEQIQKMKEAALAIDKESNQQFKKELFSKRGEWISSFDEAESDGTKTYAVHLFNIVLSIYFNSLSIHDEFNGLQSELIEMLITLFQVDRFSDIPNSENQIIISTHDTNLMEIPNLLMNHVWFVDKKNNMSELYSASDFEEVTKENLVDKYKKNRLRAKFHSNAYRVSKYFLKDNDNDSSEK